MTNRQIQIVSHIENHYNKKAVLPAITMVAKHFKRHRATIYDHLHRVGISYQMDQPEKTIKQINKVLDKQRKKGSKTGK